MVRGPGQAEAEHHGCERGDGKYLPLDPKDSLSAPYRRGI